MAIIVEQPTVITVDDLASYLRVSQLDASANLLVELANSIAIEAAPATLAQPFPARMRAITLEVAARAYRNPNGYSSETVDDYTYRRDADTRAAGVYLTDAEAAELARMGGATRMMRAGTIQMTSPLDLP